MTCNDAIQIILGDIECSPDQIADYNNHLQRCCRCYSMLEIVSPLALDQDDSWTHLDAGALEKTSPSPAAISVALDTAERLNQFAAKRRTPQSLANRKIQFVVAFLAGFAASSGAFAILRSEPVPPHGVPQTVCLWETPFHSDQTEAQFVQSCVACHLPAN